MSESKLHKNAKKKAVLSIYSQYNELAQFVFNMLFR